MAVSNPVSDTNINAQIKAVIYDGIKPAIARGSNSKPLDDTPAAAFGGTTTGPAIVSYNVQRSSSDLLVRSADLFNAAIAVANGLRNVRKVSWSRKITNGATSALETSYTYYYAAYGAPSISRASYGVSAGSVIENTNLDNLLVKIRNDYRAKRDIAVAYSYEVCHTSCHSSCHSSRGRR